jgi:hypothetical protein
MDFAQLDNTSLRGATANKKTKWPKEFDWRGADVVMYP